MNGAACKLEFFHDTKMRKVGYKTGKGTQIAFWVTQFEGQILADKSGQACLCFVPEEECYDDNATEIRTVHRELVMGIR